MTLATAPNTPNSATITRNATETNGSATRSEASECRISPSGTRTNGTFSAAAATDAVVSDDEDSTGEPAAGPIIDKLVTSVWCAPGLFDHSDEQLARQLSAHTIRFQWPCTPGGVVLADEVPVFPAAVPWNEANVLDCAAENLISPALHVSPAGSAEPESLRIVPDRFWPAHEKMEEEQPMQAPSTVEMMSANVWNPNVHPIA